MPSRILLAVEKVCLKKVSINDSLINSGILDSISLVDLAVELEKSFQIEIPFTDINEANFETAQKILNYIQNKK